MGDTVTTEVRGAAGVVTLDRPGRHNAFDEEMIRDLTLALRAMEADRSVRVVVLSARGKSFCAGGDLEWMRRAAGFDNEENLRDARALADLFRTLNRLEKPTVARVQGPAYGGGVGLVAACDVAIAAFNAHFTISEVRLGLVPSVIGPYLIAAIGERQARRYMLTAERIPAPEAYRIGLIHGIVPDAEKLDGAVDHIVGPLLEGGPRAHAECKALIRAISRRPIEEEVIEDTARRITRVRASDEGREGVGAFLEKRRPSWIPKNPERKDG